ncbi:DUF3761 domain-containing protein [Duganella sp. sic0402]|uniref:DUF3761 domain-containing protein n=1 Tax=Duganella sp. sic0402 TaxID=2854786 RepID=UPI001C44966C|nr:DUF3761 domain-containing protein [Duganella sp. sic0402]MBV7534324.1 DUF3761 domain-containing protein [Duganella sp. sic0402]
MRLLASLLLAVSISTAAQAQLAPPEPPQIVTPKKVEPNEANLQTHGHYRNKAGQDVHSPAQSVDGKVPAGASAKCRDGSYSFSKSRRGTCSGHGGVGAWL